jgi:N utilization substance protein B
MGTRREGRELAVQVLYGIDVSGAKPEEAFERAVKNFEARDDVVEFARSLVLGVLDHRDALDARIADVSENWRLDRMSPVDRNILRLSTYELLHSPDVPGDVVLNEAIEIAKNFGSEGSASFINGVLDRIASVVAQKLRRGGNEPAS